MKNYTDLVGKDEEKGSRTDKMLVGAPLKTSVWGKLLNVRCNDDCWSLNGILKN